MRSRYRSEGSVSKRTVVGTLMCGAFLLVASATGVGYEPQAGAGQANASQQSDTTLSPAATQRALVNRYCLGCHNRSSQSGGLVLESLDMANVGSDTKTWEKVVRKLRAGMMPPPGRPRPDKATYQGLVAWLESELDGSAAAAPEPGRPVLHRLNRTEYGNAVRDLLGLEIDAASLLPPDDADLGFDNMGHLLTFSPSLFRRMTLAARRVSRMAVGGAVTPAVETYRVPKTLFQDDRMSDDLPFGSRGGTAIRHYFPLDGEYGIKIRLHRNLYDYLRGLGQQQQLEVSVDGELLKMFTLGGQKHGKNAPLGWSGNIEGDPDWEDYWLHADDKLDVRVPVKAGSRLVSVYFAHSLFELEGVRQPRVYGKHLWIDETFGSPSGKPEAAVESVAISGPYHPTGSGVTPSRTKIFACRADRPAAERTCAEKILSALARRAFRRPLRPNDVESLMAAYKIGSEDGGFEDGVQLGIERILLDPEFLMRMERDPPNVPPGTVYRLTDIELASRLSFFLWSSIPDDELLDVAARGKLRDSLVLEQQVRRMLLDGRSKALVDSFAGQWLGQRKLRGIGPIPELFPDFDDNMREAFLRETELFMQSQLREDRSVLDLLRSDYTFVNEQLARHYDLSSVYGSHFRRVTLGDGKRGGLLGQAGILALNSYPNRTSPVVRGYWILEQLLGAPPPPPPPNVPTLPDTAGEGKLASVRERLERHRRNPVCATCHSQMDPLGFALENFDAIGKWRDTSEGGGPVDASGVSPDGTAFQGLSGLREFLLNHQDQFVDTLTEKLLTYALGRGVTHADMPALRTIRREAVVSEFRWSSLILAIVKSVPFQMRRTES